MFSKLQIASIIQSIINQKKSINETFGTKRTNPIELIQRLDLINYINIRIDIRKEKHL